MLCELSYPMSSAIVFCVISYRILCQQLTYPAISYRILCHQLSHPVISYCILCHHLSYPVLSNIKSCVISYLILCHQLSYPLLSIMVSCVISYLILCYQLWCQECFQLAIIFKFVADKILYQCRPHIGIPEGCFVTNFQAM